MDGFEEWRSKKNAAGAREDECNPLDYMKVKGYNLLVEPIVWFTPKDSLEKVKYKNVVYGTVSNFVQCFLISEHQKYTQRYKELVDTRNKSENHGGKYSTLVGRVGKISLFYPDDIYSKDAEGKEDRLLFKGVIPKEVIPKEANVHRYFFYYLAITKNLF